MRLKLLVLILLFINGISIASHFHRTSNELMITKNAYVNWLQHMGSLNHSVFEEAKNQFTPCKKIKVHKNPRLGDYTTLQQAINSIPVINNCRVVISVSAGTYK